MTFHSGPWLGRPDEEGVVCVAMNDGRRTMNNSKNFEKSLEKKGVLPYDK